MTEYNSSAVGKVIKRLRKEKRLTQEVFSGLCGIARSHLAMIENDEKKANFETIWKIANAFDMQVSKLVELIEEQAELMQKQSSKANGEPRQ